MTATPPEQGHLIPFRAGERSGPRARRRLLADRRSEALLEAQKQTLEMLVRGAPLAHVLARLTSVVEAQAGGRVVASILILSDDGRLYTGAAPSLPDSYNGAIDGLQASADLGTCSVAAVTGRTVITPSFETDPKWSQLKDLPLGLGLKGAWSQPIKARDGRVLGTFGTYFRKVRKPTSLERRLVETLSETAALAIERDQSEKELAQQRRMFDTALEAAEMGAWRYTLADNICVFSERAQALYGVAQARYLHDEAGVRTLLHPDDIAAMWRAVEIACDPDGAGRYSVEYRTRRPDGSWRWLSVWGAAEFETLGGVRRAVALTGASRDVSERKLAEEHQRLLVNELNHRVKNTLATVQSLMNQTLRTAPDMASARERTEARIHSLARAHDILTQQNWSGADLTAVAARALEPFDAEQNLSVRGAPVRLTPEQALAVSMALHELATNAVKYGALSVPVGQVELGWERVEEAGAPALRLSWRESGGPPVTPPTRRGFGTRLLQRGLAGELGGVARLDYAPEGVAFETTFRL